MGVYEGKKKILVASNDDNFTSYWFAACV